MNHKSINEITVSVAFVVLLVIALNPFGWYMATSTVTLLVALLVIVFGILVGTILGRKPADEREVFHNDVSGRFGYLAGLIALMVIIVIQNIQGNIEPWAFILLGIMVLARMVGTWWSRWFL